MLQATRSSSNITTSPLQRFLGLEGLRFLCAFSVLLWHYQNFYYKGTDLIDFKSQQQPLYNLFWPMYDYGSAGVRFFWAISGFIFFWKYRETIATGHMSGVQFFVLRFSRLYPLHLATLLIVAALQLLYWCRLGSYYVYPINDIPHFILQLGMASNWLNGYLLSFNGPIWSVSIEILIYILFYWIVRITGGSFTVVAGIAALSLFLGLTTDNLRFIECVYYFFIGGSTVLLLGMLPASAMRATTAIFVLFCLALILLVTLKLGMMKNEGVAFIIKRAALPVILYAAAVNWPLPKPVAAILAVAGNMTYSSYLLQFPLQLGIVLLFQTMGLTLPLSSPYFFCFFLIITFGSAFLTYHYFEIPAQNRLRSFLRLRFA